MMRSLFAGVAGLRTHQTRMDVIGNNIANVNTAGYKAQSMTFNDLMYQTTKRASGAGANIGGTNAGQIGLGSKVGAINTNIKGAGAAQTTNLPFDIMITGENFFIVNNGQENLFTRAGSFYIDGAGNLAMTSTGYLVQGWGVDPANPESIRKDTVQSLRLMEPANLTYPAQATSKATISGIIDKNDPDVKKTAGKAMNLEFYDNQGYKYTAKFSVHDTGAGSTYVSLDDILDSNGNSLGTTGVTFGDATTSVTTSVSYPMLSNVTVTSPAQPAPPAAPVTTPYVLTSTTGATVTYDTSQTYEVNGLGTPAAAPNDATQPTTTPALTINAGAAGDTNQGFFDIFPALPPGTSKFQIDASGNLIVTEMIVQNSAKLNYSPVNGEFQSIGLETDGIIDLTFDSSAGTGNPIFASFSTIALNFNATSTSNNLGVATIGASRGDTSITGEDSGTGRMLGAMNDVVVTQNGEIYANYDNGMSRLLGQIATAGFPNASGLEKRGDNLYAASQNSGEFDGIGVDLTADGGYMTTGVLEMSNVDLSSEFTEMITTQRGFQANSRIITVSDTLLEELTNLKR